MDEVEDALKLGWDLTLKSIKDKAKSHADAYRCFGVMCARSMMYVLGNGKSGFEKKITSRLTISSNSSAMQWAVQ